MAGKSKNLTIRFIADTKNASKNIDGLNTKLNNFGKTTTGSPTGKGKGGVIGGTNSAMDSLSGATGGLGSKFLALAGPVGVATAAFATLAMGMKGVVSAGMEAEDAIVKLGVLFKSEVRAMRVYQQALEKSVVTPFDPKDIVAAAVQAQGYIGKAGDVFTKGLYGMKGDAATLIADMASFSGQTAVEAATALFRADLALLDKYGADARKVYTKAKKVGAIGSEAFVKTFVKGMSQVTTWQGMAAKKSATISGLVSTIKGNIGLIATYLSGATEKKGVVTFWSSLRTVMTDISTGLGSLIKEIKPVLTIVGAIIGNELTRAWTVIKYIWGIIGPFVKAIWSIVLPIIKILFAISNFLTKIFVAVFKLIGGMESIVRGWLASILGISTGISTVVGWLEKFLLWLNMIFTLVMGGIEGWIVKITTWLKNLPELIKWILVKAWEYVSAFFKKVWTEVARISKIAKGWVGGKITAASEFATEQKEKLSKVITEQKEKITERFFGESEKRAISEEEKTPGPSETKIDKSVKSTTNNNNTYNVFNLHPGEGETNFNLTGAPAQ